MKAAHANLQVVEYPLGHRDEFAAGRRGRHLAGGTLEQRQPKCPLEPLDAQGERGLRDPEMGGSGDEAAILGDGLYCGKLTRIDFGQRTGALERFSGNGFVHWVSLLQVPALQQLITKMKT